MKTRAFLALLLVSLASGPAAPSARAWNATGHMTIASMTYDQLAPEARARWTELLRQHPDFAKWMAVAPKEQADFDEGRYLFMKASTWPDDIRKSGNPFDHPVWHYIDYPLEGPDFPDEPAPTDTEDVLGGIARCEAVLEDPAAAASDRAAHLSWLIHLVGDLQQPLHCAALITPEHPKPGGDRGGNLVFFLVGGVPVNLHWFWDCLPGTTLDHRELIEKGRQSAEKFPRAALPELAAARDPKAWSREGRALCLEAVYRHGALAGGKLAGPDDPPLPEGYFAAARAVAERRVALAGYRLADELREVEEKIGSPTKVGAEENLSADFADFRRFAEEGGRRDEAAEGRGVTGVRPLRGGGAEGTTGASGTRRVGFGL